MKLRTLSLVLAMFGLGIAACGNADAENPDFGTPPDLNKFDPGKGGGDGPYGYGSYGEGPSKVECPLELKRCPHTITYPAGDETSVELRGDFGGPGTWEQGVPMKKEGDVWKAEIQIPIDVPIQFKFVLDGTKWVTDPAQETITDDQGNTNNTAKGAACENPTCEEQGELPPGVFDWRDSVIYFVFVDRFANGNTSLDQACRVEGVSGDIADYQGGDWPGVTQKINDGYFNDLGVNTLWITVPFENFGGKGKGAFDDKQYSGSHGYWPKLDSSDPTQLNHESCYGSFDDLKTLIDAAHKKGLKVLFDFAMVHVHSSSGIYQQHNDWFWENKNGDNNCVCGQGCDWDRDGQRCWFTDYLPHWNYTNAEARKWSVDNAVAWIMQTKDASGLGVDGFRADAIKHVDMSWLTDVRKKIREEVTSKQTPQQRFYMVGETYTFDDRSLLRKYVEPTTKLDGQFDFPLRKHIVDAAIMRKESMTDLSRFMDGNDYFYGSTSVMSTFIGNHDLPRIIHLAQNTRPSWANDQGAGGKEAAWSGQPAEVGELEAYERVANGFAVLYTNRGAPLVYYGDEIGLPGAGDPDNRRAMKWTGLTDNQTFLRDRLKKLGEIRAKHPALRRGIRTTIGSDADTWLYARETTGDTVFVAINRSDSPKTIKGLPKTQLEELITGDAVGGGEVTVPPRQTRIYVAK